MSFNLLAFTPTAAANNFSASSDGVTAYPTAGALTFMVGRGAGAAHNHTLLRFDTSTIGTGRRIEGAILTMRVNAVGAPGCAVRVWARDFGTEMNLVDYRVHPFTEVNNGTSANLMQHIGVLSEASVTAGQWVSIFIPSRFIDRTGQTDLYLVPSTAATTGFNYNTAPTLSANQNVVFDGSTAVGSGTTSPDINGATFAIPNNRPHLLVQAPTHADFAAMPESCSPALGSESFLAFGVQPNCRTPVVATDYVDLLSSSLDSGASNIPSNALRRERSAPVKMAIGGAGAGGNFSFELTPNRVAQLLRGMFRLHSSGIVGSHGVTDVHEHVFRVAPASNIRYFTLVQGLSNWYKTVYPNCLIDSIGFSIGLDGLVTADCSVLSNDEFTYRMYDSGLNDSFIIAPTAAYDGDAPLSFVGGQVSLNDVVNNSITNVRIDIANNGEAKRAIRRRRMPSSNFPGRCTVSVSFDMYFDNIEFLTKFLGISTSDYPQRVRRSIQFDNFSVAMAGPLGEAAQEWAFNFPRMMYTTVAKGVTGEGAVMLSCAGMGTFDSTIQGGMEIRLRQPDLGAGVSYETITSPAPITVLPDDGY